jgi:hypothetical protein
MMKRFIFCALLLLAVPMALLNPLGREAFLGYYAGVAAMWFVVVGVGAPRRQCEAISSR